MDERSRTIPYSEKNPVSDGVEYIFKSGMPKSFSLMDKLTQINRIEFVEGDIRDLSQEFISMGADKLILT